MNINNQKQKVFEMARQLAATNNSFTTREVTAELGDEFTERYVAYRLKDLSRGSFPLLRRLTDGTVSLIDAEYISSKVKEPKMRELAPGMDQETYHRLYGCFGIAEVVKGGRYIINRAAVNRVRLKVSTYFRHHKPNRIERRAWLKWLAEKEYLHTTKQSLQIGIIHALQSLDFSYKDIYGLLCEVWGDINKGHNIKDMELRARAAEYRKSLSL